MRPRNLINPQNRQNPRNTGNTYPLCELVKSADANLSHPPVELSFVLRDAGQPNGNEITRGDKMTGNDGYQPLKYREIIADLMNGLTLDDQLKKRKVEGEKPYLTHQSHKSVMRKKIMRVYSIESAVIEYHKMNKRPIEDMNQISQYITDHTLFKNFDCMPVILEMFAAGWKLPEMETVMK
ncbi:hypothetical protein [Methanosarcina acetivorans]|uniref:Uncharacterized protein n=1 Tax=Methanosarcina acetivorans (strain ATCC 35395 / DSM 2834 / JCM 12185 / C2A) TaxID=188937 RepID=Q8TQI5_METAC|nr:hypothetical protein [Methanosarcina acetivorans]AAM04971.1 predicted protein [Methanosarcina acetivorans C2A]